MLVGASRYDDPAFPDTPAVANSLTGLCEVLTDRALGGWPQERVTIVDAPRDAPMLVRSLRRWAEETEDVFLLYFAGHGVLQDRGELCLVLEDTVAEDPDVTGLEYQRIRDLLVNSPARVKIVILDCCYSGRAIRTLAGTDFLADTTDVQGVYTLTASDHAAHVPPLAEQRDAPTSFTGQLLDVLREGVPGEGEWLTLSAVYRRLRRRVEVAGLPPPNQRGTDTADRHGLVRNASRAAAAPSVEPVLRPGPAPELRRARFRRGSGQDEARISRPFHGTRRIAVLGCAPGAGQTATTLALGQIFAGRRREPVIALDLDPGAGSLARRVRIDSHLTVHDLVAVEVATREDLRPYVSRIKGGLDVATSGLSGDRVLSDVDYARLLRTLDGHYALILADPGPDRLAHLLPHVDQIVLVGAAGPATISGLTSLLTTLEAAGHGGLCSRAAVALVGTGGDARRALAEARALCRTVIPLPRDGYLGVPRTGYQRLEPLGAGTRRAYAALAAALADDFDIVPHRYRH
ncbi:hypothetical protein GCM10027589_23280 [Actinocorallia lasiicapitis]